MIGMIKEEKHVRNSLLPIRLSQNQLSEETEADYFARLKKRPFHQGNRKTNLQFLNKQHCYTDLWDLFLHPLCKDQHLSPSMRMISYKLGNATTTGKVDPKGLQQKWIKLEKTIKQVLGYKKMKLLI